MRDFNNDAESHVLHLNTALAASSTQAPVVLGPQTPTKKLAHWVDLLGKPLSQNHVSKFSRANSSKSQ